MKIERPGPGEHHEYFSLYIDRVPDTDILLALEGQAPVVASRFGGFGEEGALYRYAAGKWSVKEILGHLNDTERLFVYRALTFARGDATELPGMDENAWVAGADFDRVPLSALIDEFTQVRSATLALFRSLRPRELARGGVSNGSWMSVRAVPWVLAGHSDHHLAVLEERYRRS